MQTLSVNVCCNIPTCFISKLSTLSQTIGPSRSALCILPRNGSAGFQGKISHCPTWGCQRLNLGPSTICAKQMFHHRATALNLYIPNLELVVYAYGTGARIFKIPLQCMQEFYLLITFPWHFNSVPYNCHGITDMRTTHLKWITKYIPYTVVYTIPFSASIV